MQVGPICVPYTPLHPPLFGPACPAFARPSFNSAVAPPSLCVRIQGLSTGDNQGSTHNNILRACVGALVQSKHPAARSAIAPRRNLKTSTVSLAVRAPSTVPASRLAQHMLLAAPVRGRGTVGVGVGVGVGLAQRAASTGSRSSKSARARGAWPSASIVVASDARARAGSHARHGGSSAEG